MSLPGDSARARRQREPGGARAIPPRAGATPPTRFHDRTAIVTGAARGIGRAVALRLASEGAAVVVTDVAFPDDLEVTATACRKGGGTCVSVVADLASATTAEDLARVALEEFGTLDVAINNAYSEVHGGVEVLALEGWEHTLRITLTAAMLVCKAALPAMVAQSRGAIVNVGSIHATAAGHEFAAYEAAKAGMMALTRSIAVDYGRYGVRCNAVAPGLVITERMKSWWDENANRRHAMATTIPVGRPGRGEEIAGAVAYLASDEASFVNGACLTVDGGASAALGENAVLDLIEAGWHPDGGTRCLQNVQSPHDDRA